MPPTTSGSPGDALGPYRRKRDFARTQEPPGDDVRADTGRAPGRFVVQRHRARRLHYDVRLELDGVLVSWAVPKGPTLDPGVRRAAFRVEDHPIEYVDFEGIIPAGQYGGGDVIVWDTGTWRPQEAGDPPDPRRALEAGELHLDLFGEKLRGRFVLVRTSRARAGRDRAGRDGARRDGTEREEWLLLHKRDEFATEGWDAEDHPRSVLSGRTNAEVKAAPDRMWRSDLPAAQASVLVKPSAAARPAFTAADVAPAAVAPASAVTPASAVAPADDEDLRELDALGGAGTWQVFGRDLRVTNLDKVLFPPRPGEDPVTKRDLLAYTARIAPTVLPYLTGRALNMHRYPNGATAKGFWHKELPDHAPDWLPRWENPAADPGETRTYLVVDEPAALVWAANFGALEWHAWTSRTDRPDRPTYALIDLDPGERTTWQDLLTLARLHRTAFEHLGVTACPKVTGRRGIQIWVPIVAGPDFDTTRDWVERLSRTVGAVVPDLVSWKWQVTERSGLARLDYTQNAVNKTLVAPYSPRPAAGAPVSAPIRWEELDDPGLAPDAFTVRTVLRRLDEQGDLFRDVLLHPQHLPELR